MQLKEAYLERVGAELEDLAARVALLKTRIAKQNVSVPLEHRWQLAWVRNRFENFKRRVEQLEGASEENLEEARLASELASERPAARCGCALVRASLERAK